jgi:transcriptional regulator with XRE-family HTH domain
MVNQEKKDYRLILSGNLKKIRKDRKISQEYLANLAGLDRSYIGKVERCEKAATIDVIGKLADALDVDVVDFFDEDLN